MSRYDLDSTGVPPPTVTTAAEAASETPGPGEDLRNLPDVVVNRLAQRFYEASEISIPMTDKPKVVAGLRAVFAALAER